MTRSLQAKLLILAVFVIGALTGAVLADVYKTRVESSLVSDEGSQDPAARRRRPPIERFEDFLELDETQRDQLATILQESRERYRDLQAETRPMYRALTEQSQNDIRGILTEEQRERYEAFLVRVEEAQSRARGARDAPR